MLLFQMLWLQTLLWTESLSKRSCPPWKWISCRKRLKETWKMKGVLTSDTLLVLVWFSITVKVSGVFASQNYRSREWQRPWASDCVLNWLETRGLNCVCANKPDNSIHLLQWGLKLAVWESSYAVLCRRSHPLEF